MCLVEFLFSLYELLALSLSFHYAFIATLYYEIILVVLLLQVFSPAKMRRQYKACNGLDN